MRAHVSGFQRCPDQGHGTPAGALSDAAGNTRPGLNGRSRNIIKNKNLCDPFLRGKKRIVFLLRENGIAFFARKQENLFSIKPL